MQQPQKLNREQRCAQTKQRNIIRRGKRRAVAELLLAERAHRSTADQLRLIERRRGESKKEKARLLAV